MTNIGPEGTKGALTAQPAGNPEVKFVDDSKAPEFFTTEATGFFINAGNIHVTFAAPRVNHATSPGPIVRQVMLRIVMPVPTAQALAAGLYSFLKERGLDPVPTPPKGEMQ